MKKLSRFFAVALLVTGATLLPAQSAQAFFGWMMPWNWFSGPGWWDDYYYPYYGGPWGYHPYHYGGPWGYHYPYHYGGPWGYRHYPYWGAPWGGYHQPYRGYPAASQPAQTTSSEAK